MNKVTARDLTETIVEKHPHISEKEAFNIVAVSTHCFIENLRDEHGLDDLTLVEKAVENFIDGMMEDFPRMGKDEIDELNLWSNRFMLECQFND